MCNFQQDIKYITPTSEQCNQNNIKIILFVKLVSLTYREYIL